MTLLLDGIRAGPGAVTRAAVREAWNAGAEIASIGQMIMRLAAGEEQHP